MIDYLKYFRRFESPDPQNFPDHTWDFCKVLGFNVKVQYSCSKYGTGEKIAKRKIIKVYVSDDRGHEMIFQGHPTDISKFGLRRDSLMTVAQSICDKKFIVAFKAPFYW